MLPTSGPDSPTPPPFVPAPAPAPGWAPAAPRAPRRSRPWVAIGLLIAGFVVLLAVFGAFVVAPGPDEYPVVAVPGRRSVDLTAGSTYTLYFEYPDARGEERDPPVVRVTGPTGDEEPLGPSDAVLSTYETTTGGRQGRAFASIHPTVSGTYRIEVEGVGDARPSDELQVTVGREEGDTALVLEGMGVLLGLALLVAGTAALLVRLVRRRRASLPVGVGPPPAFPAPSSPQPGPAPVDWAPPDPEERAED